MNGKFIPNFGVEEENWQPIEKPSSTFEVVQASLELGWNSAETSSLYRLHQLKKAERTDDITEPGDLNEMFPDLEEPVTEPTSLSKIKKISEFQQERRKLQEVIQNGGDGLGTKAISFVSSVAAGAFDPIGIAAGLATGGVFNSVLGKGLTSSKFVNNVIENAIGNTFSEAIVYGVGEEELRDQTVYESAVNVIGGAVAFPAVLHGVKWAAGATAKQLEKYINLTEARLEAGKSPALTKEEIDLVQRGDEAINEIDHVSLREQVNAKENNILFDERAASAVADIDNVEDLDFTTKIDEDTEMWKVDHPEVEKMKTEAQTEIDTTDEVIKMAAVCLRGA